MFRRLDPDSELGEQVSAFIAQQKEQNMEKKFTEQEYQKITDCFDNLNKEYNMGLFEISIVEKMLDELCGNGKFNFIKYSDEIVAIANPLTRKWAHDQFVEKEKKYYWKSKKQDRMGYHRYLYMKDGVISPIGIGSKFPFTESEIREWGYNPDMFDREEVD